MINELIEEAYQTAKEKGWWERDPALPELIALMHSELSEVIEEYRNGRGLTETYYDNKHKPCGIPSELADIIIRALAVCGRYDIDLETALIEKMDYNKKREYRHGDKVV